MCEVVVQLRVVEGSIEVKNVEGELKSPGGFGMEEDELHCVPA